MTAAALAALLSSAFAWFIRLPLPFDGFAAVAAAGLAAFGTLALIACAPKGWVWSEAELLQHSFQVRHGLGKQSTAVALEAIATAHQRAETLRRHAKAMREDMSAQINIAADRLDAAAREIFYVPDRQRYLRSILVRSELIEDAAAAHAKLRKRKSGEAEDASRAKLSTAVEALEAAFEQSDLLAARGLLQDVEIASDVAERLLAPRQNLRDAHPTDRSFLKEDSGS
ncbi:MAG: hypothetical protein AAF066_09790 [Pseudomonadota bacterium]